MTIRNDHMMMMAMMTIITNLAERRAMTTRDSSQRDPKDTPDERFNVYGEAYELKRYPTRHRPELRAWDTADQYLLETLKVRCPEARQVCVVHDQFGAITLPLLHLSPDLALPPGSPSDSPSDLPLDSPLDLTRDQSLELISYGDSWMSRRALELNIELNPGFDLELKRLTFEESLESLVSLDSLEKLESLVLRES